MRICTPFSLVTAIAVSLASSSTLADTFKIASFSDLRSYKYFLGETQHAGGNPAIEGYDWYSAMRGWLTEPDIFWPGLNVTLHEISDARTDLPGNNIDLLIMNEVVPLDSPSAAGEEAATIADFILGGGCVVTLADTLDCVQGTCMGNKVLAALDGGTLASGRAGRYGDAIKESPQTSTAGYFTLDPGSSSNLVWGGAFTNQIDGTALADPLAGDQDDILNNGRFGATWHMEVLPGQWSQVVGQREIDAGMSNFMMEILGSDIDAGLGNSGAGNVLVVGDPLFANNLVFTNDPNNPIAPGFAHTDPANNDHNYNNAKILMNFVYQQAIPEPGTLVMLAVALATLAGSRRMRRRKTVD